MTLRNATIREVIPDVMPDSKPGIQGFHMEGKGLVSSICRIECADVQLQSKSRLVNE